MLPVVLIAKLDGDVSQVGPAKQFLKGQQGHFWLLRFGKSIFLIHRSMPQQAEDGRGGRRTKELGGEHGACRREEKRDYGVRMPLDEETKRCNLNGWVYAATQVLSNHLDQFK